MFVIPSFILSFDNYNEPLMCGIYELCCDEYIEYLDMIQDFLLYVIKLAPYHRYHICKTKLFKECIINNSICAFEKLINILNIEQEKIIAIINNLFSFDIELYNCDSIIIWILNNYNVDFNTLINLLMKFCFNKQINTIKIIFEKILNKTKSLELSGDTLLNTDIKMYNYITKICKNNQFEILKFLIEKLHFLFLESNDKKISLHIFTESINPDRKKNLQY